MPEPRSDGPKPGASPAVTEPEAQRNGSPSEATRKLLARPPAWLQRQIEHARGQGFPEVQLKALAAAVAKEVLGDGTRGAEVLPAVEAFLTHGVGCDCEECV